MRFVISPLDELLSSQERGGGMKDVIVSVETSKDSDADSSKPSSKATSLQNSPAIQKGQMALMYPLFKLFFYPFFPPT